jgi:hypothetical protein
MGNLKGKCSYTYSQYPYPENIMRDLYSDRSSFTDEEITKVIDIIDNQLKPRHREVLYLRYKEQLTFIEIGNRLDLSRDRPRQLVIDALRIIWCRYLSKKRIALEEIVKKEKEQQYTENPGLIPIEDIGLTVRAYNCLYRKGLKNVNDIMALEKEELYNIRNLGLKSIEDIIHCLEAHGVIADKFK